MLPFWMVEENSVGKVSSEIQNQQQNYILGGEAEMEKVCLISSKYAGGCGREITPYRYAVAWQSDRQAR